MTTNEEPWNLKPLLAGIVLTLCVLGTVLLALLIRSY
jgi:hypothetical protein